MDSSPRSRTPKRVTRKDVARLAGVSTATVSYVLNKSQKVPEATAARVMAAVEELSYRPNLVARSLVTNRSHQLAIVLNNIANPIYADLILGFENEAIQAGYFVNICTGNRNLDDYLEHFASRQIDGLFIEALPYKFHSEKIAHLLDAGIRMVFYGNIGIDPKSTSMVETDYLEAMEIGVSFLAGLGHERIAYVSGLTKNQTSDRRIEGYCAAMDRHGLDFGDELLISPRTNTDTEIRDGAELTRRLLTSTKRTSERPASGKGVTAIIATNDLMAIGAIQAIKAAGLRVPQDISVLGIDDASIATLCEPALSTLALDFRDIGKRAFQMLLADITSETKGYYLNRVHLVERDSTGPVG